MRENDDDTGSYKVVINHEEQYSIWPENRANPLGWTDVGVSGSKADCLNHIEQVWTDMRPLSLRKWMAEHPDDAARTEAAEELPAGRDLVEFLSSTDHRAILVIRSATPRDVLKSTLARPYVQIRFPETQGGTELTVRIDRAKSELSALDRDSTADSEISLVGHLELDERAVECRAKIKLSTCEGVGRLIPLDRVTQ